MVISTTAANRHTTTVGSWFENSTARYGTTKQINFMNSTSNDFRLTEGSLKLEIMPLTLSIVVIGRRTFIVSEILSKNSGVL